VPYIDPVKGFGYTSFISERALGGKRGRSLMFEVGSLKCPENPDLDISGLQTSDFRLQTSHLSFLPFSLVFSTRVTIIS
jgi:hypothetical protein